MTKAKKSLLIIPMLIALIFTIFMVTACGEKDTDIHVSSITELKTALTEGGTIVLDGDIEGVNEVLTVTKDVTLNLNAHEISSSDELVYNASEGTWSLFVVRGATLTVTGNGTIDAKKLFTFSVQSKYDGSSATANANKNVNSSKLVIENGTFKGGHNNNEGTVVYIIGAGSTCEIKGGHFSSNTTATEWLLNTFDASETAAGKSLFSVTGGTFEGFDPKENGHDYHSHVPTGYESNPDTDVETNYVVTKSAD